MKVTVNPTTCIASGNCSRTAPRVFANRDEDDGFVSLLDEHPPESEWAAARDAESLCPSATIRIEEDEEDPAGEE
ncbi:ferredoxin [Microbacterium sp.]|uniref:ferredoxin n=1 Tax=Microbacterium sp. TaxID=51671 RepID=UPI002734306B|nr:ferredoxin [Microbacterium sp.]MDP3950625.1 ferredoxin [Microbacterium sp.]